MAYRRGCGGSGGSSTLAGLTDTDVTGVTDGQTLVWNATTSKWEAHNECCVAVHAMGLGTFKAITAAATDYAAFKTAMAATP